ncbi:MAG: hypothetical protein ACW99Q_07130 [Candidatus Kariarchaeaceae archaeon]|jgi:heme/copper-type cytochrome/quinol oxidase subunit 2
MKLYIGLTALLLLSTYFYGSAFQISNKPSQITFDEEIKIEARRFEFKFTFENGTSVDDRITLLTQVSYLINVTGLDQTMGFVLEGEAFSTNVGSYQSKVITFDTPGQRTIQCNVFCGSGHSGMSATISVLSNPNSTTDSNTITSSSITSTSSIPSNTATDTAMNTGVITQSTSSTSGDSLSESISDSSTTLPETSTSSETSSSGTLIINGYLLIIGFTVLMTLRRKFF